MGIRKRIILGSIAVLAVLTSPALAKNSDQDDLNTITLSYTFYPLRDPQRPVADNATLPAPGRL